MADVTLDISSDTLKDLLNNPTPVGTIIAIHPGVDISESLISGYWVLCNGVGNITFTLYNGIKIIKPNYDLTDGRFLMGSSSPGSPSMDVSDTSIPSVAPLPHQHTIENHIHNLTETVLPYHPSTVSDIYHGTHYAGPYFQVTEFDYYTSGNDYYFPDSATTDTGTTTPPPYSFSSSHLHFSNSISNISSIKEGSSFTESESGSDPIPKSLPKYFQVRYAIKIK